MKETTDAIEMRFLMNEAKIDEIREELWDFARLPPNKTGLPYNIYVDCGQAYRQYGHQLWLYVEIGKQMVPVTIGHDPKPMVIIRHNGINFGDICRFIHLNYKQLINLADGKTEYDVFSKIMRNLEGKSEVSPMLSEMSTLSTRETLLPMVIWVDEDGLYQGHAPRIKFRENPQNSITRNDPSMEINDPTKIHRSKKNENKLTSEEIHQLQMFVEANRELLLDLCNKKISIDEFKIRMRKVNGKGDIVNGVDEPEMGMMKNGWIKCRKNGKFNFCDEEGNFLFKDFCLDTATDFDYVMNGQFVSYVTKDGESFYIDMDGNRVEIY